jgi:hypothetical protein
VVASADAAGPLMVIDARTGAERASPCTGV